MSSESVEGEPAPAWKYRVLLAYDGTGFVGWQRQRDDSDGPSIQATIEAALERMTGERPAVVGSGRTDSGVHAVGQCAHFTLKRKEWPAETLKRGLNSLLGKRIQVLEAREAPLDFHSQRSALRKQYSYYFQQGPCALPHLEPYSWWIRKQLDLEAMNRALAALVGEHDFKPFQATGSVKGRSTVRRILEAETSRVPVGFPLLPPEDVSLVRIRVLGTGFLKQMVRGIAGTLLQVGEGRRDSGCIAEILRAGDRSAVGPTAPARALWLERVWYED